MPAIITSVKGEFGREYMAERKSSFNFDDLIECAHGRLFGAGNCLLPMPPMLMIDRITQINGDGGAHGKGYIEAEYDISPDRWFFDCHFVGDPVMPGCLGLDGLWQLTGFFLGWMGGNGLGRALGLGELKLRGMVLPDAKRVTYKIDIKRLIMRRLVMAVADGTVNVDGEQIFTAKDIRVGVFVAEEKEAS